MGAVAVRRRLELGLGLGRGSPAEDPAGSPVQPGGERANDAQQHGVSWLRSAGGLAMQVQLAAGEAVPAVPDAQVLLVFVGVGVAVAFAEDRADMPDRR